MEQETMINLEIKGRLVSFILDFKIALHAYVKVTANGSPSGTATTTIVT